MKNKALMGLIATATIGTAVVAPTMINNHSTTQTVNKVLMVNNTSTNSTTNEAVVINGNSSMNLYALSNGSGIVSNLSTGEMLTILGQSKDGYYKVKVQETGAVGYISTANMQNILNGTNASLTALSEGGQVINVSSNLRLRSNPAISNNIIGHLSNGTNLNILGKQGQWYKVSVNGEVGFVYGEYISVGTSSSATMKPSGQATNSASSSSSQSSNSASNSNTIGSTSSTKNTTASNTKSSSSSSKITTRTKSSPTASTTGTTSSKVTNSSSSNNVASSSSNGTTNTTEGNSQKGNVTNETAYITNVATNNVPIFNVPIGGGESVRFQLDNGQQVTVLGEEGNSYKINYSGNTGYVNKDYITFQNNENQIHPNDNSQVSSYFGTWTVGKQIGSTIGRAGTFKSYEGQKITMTSSLYSFNGTTVENPNYYIVTVNPGVLFGNSQYNDISNVQTNQYGQIEVIIAVPSSEKVTNSDFINKVQISALENAVIISGNSLLTHGGGTGDSEINQCVKGNVSTTTSNNKGTTTENSTSSSQSSSQSKVTK